MKIIVLTHIGAYKTNCFPRNLVHVPRIGEKVEVVQAFHTCFQEKGLPVSLQVKEVIHSAYGILVNVHYSETSIKAMELAGTDMYP